MISNYFLLPCFAIGTRVTHLILFFVCFSFFCYILLYCTFPPVLLYILFTFFITYVTNVPPIQGNWYYFYLIISEKDFRFSSFLPCVLCRTLSYFRDLQINTYLAQLVAMVMCRLVNLDFWLFGSSFASHILLSLLAKSTYSWDHWLFSAGPLLLFQFQPWFTDTSGSEIIFISLDFFTGLYISGLATVHIFCF